jgi:MFS family permease
MKKTIFALAAAATIAVSTLSPTPADAQRRGLGLGLGILGGVVVGTIIGSAIANHPGYYRYDDYYGDAPYDCRGYWARKAWRDQDGNIHYGRPQYFCD